jgi:hypothetical protein
MAACSACGTTILFGGRREGDLRFCNAKCDTNGVLVREASRIPRDVIQQRTAAIYHGRCPQCAGAGPVDVRTSYRIYSALVFTSWQNTPKIACRSCGVKSQLGSAAFSLFLGWWGIPWGLIMTPIQITRNIAGALSRRADHGPTPQLERTVSLVVASERLRQQAVSASSVGLV